MNPEHFHLEFYEDDNRTMPVLTWLNRLESDDMAKHDAIVYGLQVILAREGAGVCGTEFGRTLGKGLYEFRLRHTRDELQIKAESQQAGSGPSVQPVKVLIRVFFAVYGDRIVLLLGGYDKAVDDSRHRQNREIEQARGRLRAHQQQQKSELKAQRRGSGAEEKVLPNRPEERVPSAHSFLMWSRARRRGREGIDRQSTTVCGISHKSALQWALRRIR